MTTGLRLRALVLFCLLGVLAACNRGDEQPAPAGWTWELPPGVPLPIVPEDNPMTEEKVELGRHLFYDTLLSGNRSFSCASCHHQELAFTDGLGQALGSTGERHARGAMSLGNVAWNATLNWANPLFTRLEDQAMVPLFGNHPIEMGMPSHEELVGRLSADPAYPSLFAAAFPAADVPISVQNVTRALAAFQRSLVSFDAPWDRYTRGDREAIDAAAKRGAELFFGERLECFHCHGGLTFASSINHEGSVDADRGFHNNGLYNVDGAGGYPLDNPGLYEITGRIGDMGRFRAPSLRNVAVTAPYMHDGSLLTLEDVLDHYARGGTLTTDGPHAGDGALNPNKSPFIVGFILSDEERADVLAFLNSLTDEGFLADPRHGPPEALIESGRLDPNTIP